MDEINKQLKIKREIIYNHHYLYLFCTQFCLYVQFIQQYNNDESQSYI